MWTHFVPCSRILTDARDITSIAEERREKEGAYPKFLIDSFDLILVNLTDNKAMVFWEDMTRVVNGLSLVVREVVRCSESGEFRSLIKAGILSATDITGLTKGKVRRFDMDNEFYIDSSIKTGVVHFRDEPTPSQPSPGSNAITAATAQSEGVQISSNADVDEDLEDANNKGLCASPSNEGELSKAVGSAFTPQPSLNKQRKPRERKVPSTPFSRALGFAGLGAGLAWGTLQESAKRIVFGTSVSQNTQHAVSPLLSEKNAERLALALCRMRGAALKLGQMLSIQDESLVPAPILAALDIVRHGADVMPKNQLNQVLDAELGPNWSSKLRNFDYEPMAAASIGQVHRAVTKDGLDVAMKIQYPGVADSIESDIENVKLLLAYTNLIPEKLYIDNAMKVAKQELSRECDYELEAKNQTRFRSLLANTKGFYIPVVVDNLSSRRVLTTELVPGVPIDKVALLCQETRNCVGEKLLELTLRELFIFRFMQTDPNWSNFLYDDAEKSINLIDFGAARDFPKRFVDDYLRMVVACANGEREVLIEMSKRLGFLTGMESEVMLEAHVQAGIVVGLPFATHGGYDFRSTNITRSISNLGATMLRYRLTPPPEEAYSLHRKLSGAFLACIKLGAVVPCRELLFQVYENYRFGED